MQLLLIRTSFALLVLIFAGFLLTANSQTVTGSIGNGTVAKGTSTRGSIVLDIPGGLHVNSNRPASEYAIGTAVRLASDGGVRAGSVSYPRGNNRKFQFSESTINVYEGRVRFPFTVKVPARYSGKTVRVRATVHYQACTNEVCYPPKSKEVTLTARVKG